MKYEDNYDSDGTFCSIFETPTKRTYLTTRKSQRLKEKEAKKIIKNKFIPMLNPNEVDADEITETNVPIMNNTPIDPMKPEECLDSIIQRQNKIIRNFKNIYNQMAKYEKLHSSFENFYQSSLLQTVYMQQIISDFQEIKKYLSRGFVENKKPKMNKNNILRNNIPNDFTKFLQLLQNKISNFLNPTEEIKPLSHSYFANEQKSNIFSCLQSKNNFKRMSLDDDIAIINLLNTIYGSENITTDTLTPPKIKHALLKKGQNASKVSRKTGKIHKTLRTTNQNKSKCMMAVRNVNKNTPLVKVKSPKIRKNITKKKTILDNEKIDKQVLNIEKISILKGRESDGKNCDLELNSTQDSSLILSPITKLKNKTSKYSAIKPQIQSPSQKIEMDECAGFTEDSNVILCSSQDIVNMFDKTKKFFNPKSNTNTCKNKSNNYQEQYFNADNTFISSAKNKQNNKDAFSTKSIDLLERNEKEQVDNFFWKDPCAKIPDDWLNDFDL